MALAGQGRAWCRIGWQWHYATPVTSAICQRQRQAMGNKASVQLITAWRAERCVLGHTVGNLSLAPQSFTSEAFPSRLLAIPSGLPPIPIVNHTIGEATSLSPGLFHVYLLFLSYQQGATSSLGSASSAGGSRNNLGGTGWPRKSADDDTDTLEARQAIRLNSIRGVWKTIRWHLACFVSLHSLSITEQHCRGGHRPEATASE